MSTERARQAAGQPTGGQFAATAGSDAGLALAQESDEQDIRKQAIAVLDAEEASGYGDHTHTHYEGLREWLAAAEDNDETALAYAAKIVQYPTPTLAAEPTWKPVDGTGRSGEMYSRSYGGKVEHKEDGGIVYRDTSDIAKDIRKDIKAAIAGGYLPEGLTTRVQTRKYSGGSSIDIQIEGMDVETYYDQRDTVPHPYGDRVMLQPSAYAKEIERRVEAIAWQYNYDGSESQTDYFDRNFYGSTRVRDPLDQAQYADFQAREARKKAARSIDSNRSGPLTPEQRDTLAKHDQKVADARANFHQVEAQIISLAERLGVTYERRWNL